MGGYGGSSGKGKNKTYYDQNNGHTDTSTGVGNFKVEIGLEGAMTEVSIADKTAFKFADALPEVVDIEARRVNRLLNAHVLWLIVHQLVFERVVSNVACDRLDEPARDADPVVVALLPDCRKAKLPTGKSRRIRLELAHRRAKHLQRLRKAGRYTEIHVEMVWHQHVFEKRDPRIEARDSLNALENLAAEVVQHDDGVGNAPEKRTTWLCGHRYEKRRSPRIVIAAESAVVSDLLPHAAQYTIFRLCPPEHRRRSLPKPPSCFM